VCYRVAQDCPTSESKITHIIEILLKLYKSHQETKKTAINERKQGYKPAAFTFERRQTPKVIIFSQFRKVLNITGDRLLRRLGSGCIAEYWGKYRKKELNKFTKDENCLCMLLGKDGSEGLDLSFVTHIIFLEQVWDKSLENQVVARAWRMGAKGSVDVETLVAEHSIEETMLFLEKDLGQNQNDSDGSAPGIQNFRSTAKGKKRSEYQQAKVHYLLNNLKLIVNANTVDFSARNKRKASIDLETTLDTQQMGAKSQAKKNGEKRHRVTFQEQLMKPKPSLILFG
jgi:SNF2 family DNA or RNA helicase